MAKQQKTKPSSDTTVVKKPYKVIPKENGMGLIAYDKMVKKPDDSTIVKMKYNREVANASLAKRNSERAKEGKKPIKQESNTGVRGQLGNVGFSVKGKTFKEAPLKSVKKKK